MLNKFKSLPLEVRLAMVVLAVATTGLSFFWPLAVLAIVGTTAVVGSVVILIFHFAR